MEFIKQLLYNAMLPVVGHADASRVYAVTDSGLLRKLQQVQPLKAAQIMKKKRIPVYGSSQQPQQRRQQQPQQQQRQNARLQPAQEAHLFAKQAIDTAVQQASVAHGARPAPLPLVPLCSEEFNRLWSERIDLVGAGLPGCFTRTIYMKLTAHVSGAAVVSAAALQREIACAATIHASGCTGLQMHVDFVRVVGLRGKHFHEIMAVRLGGLGQLKFMLESDIILKPNAALRVKEIQSVTRDVWLVLHDAILGLAALHDRGFVVDSVSEQTVLFEEREGQPPRGLISAAGVVSVVASLSLQRVGGQRRNVLGLRNVLLNVQRTLSVGARNLIGAIQFKRAALTLGCDADARAALTHLSWEGDASARQKRRI